MGENSLPKDGLGNTIRKGQLVVLQPMLQQLMVAQVIEAIEAGEMTQGDGSKVNLPGSLTLAIRIPFQQGGAVPLICLKDPSEQRIQVVPPSEMPPTPKAPQKVRKQ